MAKRRRKLHRALEGLGAGLADAGSLMLRHKLMQDQNTNIMERQAQASDRSQMFAVLQKVMSGELDPSAADAFLPDGVDPSKFMPSQERRAAKISDEINTADLGSLQQPEARVRRRMKAMNLPDIEPVMADPGNAQSMARQHLVSGVEDSDVFQSLMDEATARRGGLQSQVPYSPVTDVDERGIPRTRYTQNNQMGTLGPLQTAPSPEQTSGLTAAGLTADVANNVPTMKGEAAGIEERLKQITGALSPEVTDATVTQQNRIESGTRPGAVARAGEISFAQGANAQAAQHTPEAIMGAAKRAGEIARATAEAEIQANARGGKMTNAQATAAGNYVRIAQEHATMKELEDKGVRFSNLTHQMRNVPLIGGSIANPMGRFLSPFEQEYLRSADQFKALEGKIMSGVTVRPDEAVNFIQDLTAQSSDNPDVIAGKQAARAAILQSAQIQAGPGGSYQAGLALGKAVLNGQIPLQTLLRMEFSNADILRGLKDGYGKVVFAGVPSVVEQ